MEFAGDTTRIKYEELTTLRVLKETHGRPVSIEEFENNVNLESFLEEGESLEDIAMEDPDVSFYALPHDGKTYYGFSSCGVDNLFSEDGSMPSLGGGLDSSLNEQCRRSQLAWVLSPCGSLLAAGPMGNEQETFRTEKLARFDGDNGSTRLHLLHKGQSVSGIQIKDNTVEALYTDYGHQGKGYASKLFDYAYRLFPDLQHNKSLTDDGKAFVGKYESRRKTAETKLDNPEP